jgi:hypothetical protein
VTHGCPKVKKLFEQLDMDNYLCTIWPVSVSSKFHNFEPVGKKQSEFNDVTN